MFFAVRLERAVGLTIKSIEPWTVLLDGGST
jgi:hypothetical protein